MSVKAFIVKGKIVRLLNMPLIVYEDYFKLEKH